MINLLEIIFESARAKSVKALSLIINLVLFGIKKRKSENNTLADGDDEGIVPSNDTGSGYMSSAVQIDVILASSSGLVVSVVLVVAVLRRRASAAVEPLPKLDHEVEAYVAMLIAHGYAESEARPYAVAYYQQLRNR